jgi:NitT/TauT family transport system substrate-binding protein
VKTKQRHKAKPRINRIFSKKSILAMLLVVLGAVIIWTQLANYMNSSPVLYNGPMEHITTGNVGEYSSLAIIAHEKGFFKNNGVDVVMRDYASGPEAVADMLAGKIDTATAADFVGVSNSFKYKDLRILTTQMRADSFFMAARRDRNITSPAELMGKKIGVTSKTAGEFYLGQFLAFNQLIPSDVGISYHSPTELVDLLLEGKLDAIATFDPHIHNVQSKLGRKVLVWSLQGDQKLSTILYGTQGLVERRPEAVKRYLRGLVKAQEFTQTHDQEARDIVGQYLGHDQDAAYMQRIWSRLTFDVSLDQDLLISMEDQARWVIESKVVPEATKVPDYQRIIYFDGLEAVNPDAITIIR